MNDSTPLYSLSIKQFSALLDEKLQHFQHPFPKPNIIYETDNVDIDWVSEKFGIPKSTIRTKVSKKEMPCKQRGKPMIFSKKETIEWIENGRPKVNQEIDFAPIRKAKK